MELVQSLLDRLSNTMRMYAENSFKFYQLKEIDCEEAINNLDRSFEAKLEAFHSLYDATKKDFPYFNHADTALIIVLRNAIHHKQNSSFRSWNSEMHLNNGIKRYAGASFLLVNHYPNEITKTSEYS